MANKYISNNAWVKTEVEWLVVSAGAWDWWKIVALDSSWKLDLTVMPIGITPDTTVVPASENLAAWDFVNLWDDSWTTKARKADASTVWKSCHWFVLSWVTAPANATVYGEWTNTQVTWLTGGTRYYLSDSNPWLLTSTAPSGAWHIVQYIWTADSATRINIEPEDYIVLA